MPVRTVLGMPPTHPNLPPPPAPSDPGLWYQGIVPLVLRIAPVVLSQLPTESNPLASPELEGRWCQLPVRGGGGGLGPVGGGVAVGCTA